MKNPFEGILQRVSRTKEAVQAEEISRLRSEATGNPVDVFKQAFLHYMTLNNTNGVSVIETFRKIKQTYLRKIPLTEQEMNKLDFVRKAAFDEIAKKRKDGVSAAEREATKWIQEGVLTDEEANNLLDSEVEQAA